METSNNPPLPAERPTAELGTTDWLGLVLVSLTFLWITGLTIAVHWIGWLADQISQNLGASWPPTTWLFISLGHGVLLGLPFILAAFAWQDPRYRGVFQSWLLGIVYVFFLAPMRLVEPTNVQAANLLQIVLTAGFIVLVAIIARRKNHAAGQDKVRWNRSSLVYLGLALLPAALLAYPWLVLGALGSPTDTLLNLAAGLLFGLAVALIVVFFLLPALQASSNGRGWDLMLAGFVIGALLVMMVSALGFNGLQLLLLFALPGVGWLVAALGYPAPNEKGSRLPAVALFLGITAAAPAMFIDPDEFALILGLGGRDLLTWAFWAGLIAMLVSWIVSLFAFLWRARWSWRPPLAFVGAGAGIFLLAGLLLYFFAGQPGFHGEQLFVILGDQADLSVAESMTDYDARRQFVYETLVNHADRTQADIRSNLDTLNIAYTPYYLENAMAIDGGPLLRLWLESRPEVDRVLDNPILRPLPAPAETVAGTAVITPSLLPLWNQTLIGADQVWAEFDVTGQGIVIGQSDSGVQGDHPELVNSYRGRESGDDYNWLDPWNATTKPADIGGHGTHTLGSIVGQNTGIAPGAEWFGCVNLARNLANPALYLDCMQFMLAPYPPNGSPFTDGDPTLSAHVLNNSWGCPPLEGCDPNSLLPAVQALRAAGIFVVVSAGNEGTANCETVSHPLSLYDEVFSVGAISEFGELAEFSSLGPVTADGSGRVKPDIVAPGVNILSAFPNSTYEYLDGTSMAGPHVAGVVALIWSANPALIGQIARTEEILIATTQPYTGTLNSCVDGTRIPNNGVGYGVVDAYAAVEMALNLTP